MAKLLAIVDQAASVIQAMIRKTAAMFKTSQNLFRGEKNTNQCRQHEMEY